ncbi:MAG: prenyltransferase/squalene oxidase repeat-containing protein [Planctomycetaceae bacterium]
MKKTFLCTLLTMIVTASLFAGEQSLGPHQQRLHDSRVRATNFLRTTQADDGSWTSPDAVGISALIVYGLLKADVPVDDAMVAKGLQFIAAHSQEDGRLASPSSRHSGYETCVALMTLQAGNQSGKYTEKIKNAERFIRLLQFDEDQGIDRSNDQYGGTGYGPDGGRPDLSNTAFLVEALQATGAKAEDPALQKALVFISRCQNLETEHNTSPAAAKIDDGGFFYTVSAGGNSAAGETAEGGLRSYGSMTYAGLKSMIYAGLTPDDPRVKGAIDWIERNYTVESNPGMGNNGLFYYYQLFAKALDAMDLDHVEDAAGREHDWRQELADHLFSLQDEMAG